jgi:hypothetical protein
MQRIGIELDLRDLAQARKRLGCDRLGDEYSCAHRRGAIQSIEIELWAELDGF